MDPEIHFWERFKPHLKSFSLAAYSDWILPFQNGDKIALLNLRMNPNTKFTTFGKINVVHMKVLSWENFKKIGFP